MNAYNDDAQKTYNEKAMDRCPNCGRTFVPDRLIVHLRSCKPKNDSGMGGGAGKSLGPDKSGFKASGGGTVSSGGGSGADSMSKSFGSSPQKAIVRPKTLMCYIW